jgi:hypothetical protein
MPAYRPLPALALLLLSGCVPPLPEDAGDTDPLPDSDAAPPRCRGDASFSTSTVPDPIPRDGTPWRDGRAAWRLLRDEATDVLNVTRDPTSGCLRLYPGTAVLDLAPDRCGFDAVEIDLTVPCLGGCARVFAATRTETRASNAPTVASEPTTLRLDPSAPFTEVRVVAQDATLCALRGTVIPIDEAELPPDTGFAR